MGGILGPCFQKNIKTLFFFFETVTSKQKKGPCQATATPSSERVSTHIPTFPQNQYNNQKIENFTKIPIGSTIPISDSDGTSMQSGPKCGKPT